MIKHNKKDTLELIESKLCGISEQIDSCVHNITKILRRLNHMSVELDQLTAQVHSNSEVLASAVTLINGIADRIAAAGVDPVKLKALTDELKSKDDELAAAVVANTPQVA